MGWTWTGGYQDGGRGWQWVDDAPVTSNQPTAAAPAPAPAPAGTGSGSSSSSSATGGMFDQRRRIGGGAQDGQFEQPGFYDPANDPLMYRLPGDAQGEGSFRPIRDAAFEQARSNLFYKQDPTLAMRMIQDPDYVGLTEDEFNQWFSQEALEKEIARLTAPDPGQGFVSKFMGDLGDHGTIMTLAKAFLAWGFGGALAGALGGGTGAGAGASSAGASSVGAAEGAAAGADALSGAMGTGAGASVGTQSALAGAAGRFGANYAMTGDPKSAALSAAVPAAVGYAADFAAPYVSDAWNAAGEFFSPEYTPSADDLRRGVQVADAGTGMLDVSEPLFSPNSYMNQPGFDGTEASLENTVSPVYGDLKDGVTYSAGSFSGYDPVTGQALFNAVGGVPAADPSAPPASASEPTRSTITSQDLQRYIKIGRTVYGLLGQEEGTPPSGAPEQGDSTPEEYASQLGGYLGLDAASMAEQGLQPGTPEYMQHIMARADQVIAEVLGDMDVNAEDFAQQLRGKTEAELLALQRALYVRGQMDQLMGSGTYVDPATGLNEEVIGEGMFNPNVGAYQQGVATDVETLGGLRGQDALDFLNARLGRKTDFFGMQGQADERFELAKREDELRRRRGMFG